MKLPRENCTQKSSLQSNPHCCITLRSPLNQHDVRLLQIARQVLVQSTLRDRPCDCSMATQPKEGIFLPGLARAFEAVNTSDHISTLEFAKAVEAILPVFDRLGEVSGTSRPSGQALKPSKITPSLSLQAFFVPTCWQAHQICFAPMQGPCLLLQSQSL